jgi:hypothetical protein
MAHLPRGTWTAAESRSISPAPANVGCSTTLCRARLKFDGLDAIQGFGQFEPKPVDYVPTTIEGVEGVYVISVYLDPKWRPALRTKSSRRRTDGSAKASKLMAVPGASLLQRSGAFSLSLLLGLAGACSSSDGPSGDAVQPDAGPDVDSGAGRSDGGMLLSIVGASLLPMRRSLGRSAVPLSYL